MTAGRELDALVAEKVFGDPIQWLPTSFNDRVPHYRNSEYGNGWLVLPCYSTDISAAFQVVEKMREKGYGVTIITHPLGSTFRPQCEIDRPEWRGSNGADAATVPLAICTSALEVLAEVDQ